MHDALFTLLYSLKKDPETNIYKNIHGENLNCIQKNYQKGLKMASKLVLNDLR